MPSVEVRLILFAILFVIYVLIKTKFFQKLKERKNQQAAGEVRKRRQELHQERVRQAREQQEVQRRRTAEILVRAAPGLRQRKVAVAGQEIWFLEGGPESGPAALLLHGFAGDKENWSEVANRMAAAGCRVLAPDLPGFGQSGKDPEQSYDVTNQAKRIRAFIQKLGLAQLHLAGCSVGATIAAAYAYACPQETLSLTLIEPFGVRLPYHSELDEMLVQDRNPMVIAIPQAYDNLLGFLYAEVPEMAPALKQHRAELAAANRAFYLKMWQEIRLGDRANFLDLLLPEIKIRTLVMLGAQSRVIHGATSESIAAMMPDLSETVVIDGCGHFPMAERPEETAGHLLRFLSAAARGSAAGGSTTDAEADA